MITIHRLRERGRRSRRQAGAVLLAALLAASAGGFAAPALDAPIAAAWAAAPSSSLFTCQGSATQTYTVPDGITRVFVAAAGGAGVGDNANSSKGGLGAVVEGAVPVLPGDQISINVGCAADQRHGGAGGTGFETANGGNGGSANAYQDGGGGGGASGVFDSSGYNDVWHVYFQGFDVVAAGGGGGSGGAGLSSGHDGGNGALTTPAPQQTPDGGRGLGSVGGGGGGGGGGGWMGGAGGGGGSRLFAPGHAGDGGASTVQGPATNTQVVSGGGPRGNGFVLITPLLGQRPVPTLSLFQCQNGTVKAYTVPAGVSSLQVLVEGAGGRDLADFAGGTVLGGAGAQVQATVPVTAGQALSVDVGCQGGGGKLFESGGPGYGKGGDGGAGCDDCNDNPDGTGGGGGSAIIDRTGQPLVVAGGGGGAGGQGDGGRPGSGGDGGSAGDGSALGAAGQPASGGNRGPGGSGVTTGPNGVTGGGAHCAFNGKGVGAGAGGGGGGGYRGGNGGHSGSCAAFTSGSGGGGAGGSSFLAPAIRGTGSIVGGVSRGDGLVMIAAAPASVPLAPTLVQATGSPLQATVSFNTPADDGGSPITSYTVTSYPDGITATGTSSPIVVTGLTRQVPYTFTVHATNAVGNSPESAPSLPVSTVFLPGAPRIVSTTSGDGSATVAFNPPASDGGRPVTQYTAIARPGAASSGPGITATGTTSPITITGLTNGATYSIGVYATNALGDGPEADAGFAQPLGLPGAPTGPSAAVEPGGVSVSFTPPITTGGAPITGYTVTSSPGGITATGTTSPIVVTGLTNGVSYTFTVHATTSAGGGPESDPSNAVTWVNSTALSPPLFPSAAPGNRQATVSFHPPLDDGGSPVTSYIVTSSPGGITATGTTSPVTITGLTNGVSYTFSVVAVNANGTSQPSTQSNAVTPSASYGPPNDDFADAQPITGDVGSITGTNVQATKEPGEPDHNGDPGGASVWYAWTATHGGSIEFNTCGSDFSTELGLYMGNSVDTLTGPYGGPIYREWVLCPDGTRALAVVSDVSQDGGTFYIAVDGANAGSGPVTGNIVLNWTTQTGL